MSFCQILPVTLVLTMLLAALRYGSSATSLSRYGSSVRLPGSRRCDEDSRLSDLLGQPGVGAVRDAEQGRGCSQENDFRHSLLEGELQSGSCLPEI